MTTIEQKKQRDVSLDVTKGICIILMVVGHAGCPGWMYNFIYMFHMPLFFFISGMLLSERYIDDPKLGVLRKLKGYYKPFVKWTIVFVLLHNVFAAMHILEPSYTLGVIIKKCILSFFLLCVEIGPYWFLASLIMASIASILLLGLLKRYKLLNNISLVGVVILSVLVASVFPATVEFTAFGRPVFLGQIGPQTFLAFAFFVSGYIYKHETRCRQFFEQSWVPVVILLVVFVWSLYKPMHMLVAYSPNTKCWQYYPLALGGLFSVLALVKKLRYKPLVATFNYIGSKTLYILTFHLFSFKIVSYAWIEYHHLPIEQLSEGWFLESAAPWLWVIYSIVGVVVPLMLWEARRLIHARVSV